MRNSFFSKAVLIAASLTVAVPALANDFEAISVSVLTHDLDLNDASDIARLEIRMNRAAAAACDPGGVRGVAERRGYAACKAVAMQSGRAQLQRVMASVAGGNGTLLAARR